MPATHIIIFAKAPVAGFAKTRLIPALGAEGAAHLAEQLLTHTINCAIQANIGTMELCTTPAYTEPSWNGFRQTFTKNITTSAQQGKDLGDRMANACKPHLQLGQPVILIGTDCANMTAGLLQQAHQQLQQHQAVIYPASDGGYVLLGLQQFHPALFIDIPWGTAQVYQATQQKLQELGDQVFTGSTLHDIDEAYDLVHLALLNLSTSSQEPP